MRSRWFVCLGAVVMLFVALDATGVVRARRAASAAPTATAPQKTAQIAFTGRVLDPQGQPVADARVTLYWAAWEPASVRPKVERAEEKTTGADGAFAFTVARESEIYRDGCIVVRKEGRALGWAAWPMREDQKTDLTLGDPKELAGAVVDETSKPIAEATVSVAVAMIGREEDRRYLSASLAPEVLTTKTDDSGRFAFSQMPAEATFEFLVRKPGWATVWTLEGKSRGYREGKCQFAAGQAGIKLTLSPEAKIAGTVVEKTSGRPLAGIQVSAKPGQDAHPMTAEPVASDPNGGFSLGGLPGGSYTVQLAPQEDAAWVTEPVRVSLKAAETKSDIRLQLTKGGVLEVLVKEGAGGKPVEKAVINVRDSARDQYLGGQTNEAGLAQIRLIPGSYEVWGAYKPGYSQQRQQQPVEINDGETKRIEYTLARSPRVVGVVRDGAGNPLAGIRLAIMPNVPEEKTTDSNGKFEMSWDPGNWGPEGATFVLAARDTTRNLGGVVEIDEQMGTLDFKLQPGIVLAGRVVNHEGKALAGARLRVVLRVSNWGAFLGQGEEEKTAQDGTFEIKAIPPERQYVVTAFAEGYGKHEVRVDALKSKDGRMELGEFKLPLADLTVSGVVVDANNQPVAGAEVYANGENQPEQPNIQTDSQGKFVIQNVCAGPIRLGASVRPPARLYGSVETEGGATDVKVVVSAGPSGQRYVARKPQPLTGKRLPDLKTVGIELPGDANDRMLLVCLWDMNQRPSRHCVTQLARQAAQLSEEGVVVLAIQAAQAEPSALNQWMQDNKAPFQVGYLTGDIEKARFAWGAVSLPHLILTDKKHVVVAEGFNLSELDAKIQAASGR